MLKGMKSKGILAVNGFLSSNSFKELYGFFLDAAKKHNVELELVKNSELLFDAANKNLLFSKEADFIVFWDKDIRLAKQLESVGFKLYNSAHAIELCDDKSLTHIALSNCNIPMPKTVIAPLTYAGIGYTDTEFLNNVCDYLKFPIVVKECCGSFGQQVYLTHTLDELKRLTSEKAGIPLIFQEFVKTSISRDIRLYVVGGKVVASMLRENTNGDFRANVANGGKVSPYMPTESEIDVALRACEELSLTFGGVDILFGKDGTPLLCEVNSNAHFAGLLECTAVNAADAIMEFITGKLL